MRLFKPKKLIKLKIELLDGTQLHKTCKTLKEAQVVAQGLISNGIGEEMKDGSHWFYPSHQIKRIEVNV